MVRAPKPPPPEADRPAAAQATAKPPLVSRNVLMAGAGVGVLGLVFLALWHPSSAPPPEPDEKITQAITASVQAPSIPPDPQPAPATTPQVVPVAARPASPPYTPPLSTTLPQAAAPSLPGGQRAASGTQHPYEVFYNAPPAAPDRRAAAASGEGDGPDEDRRSTAVAFKATTLPGARAGKALDQTLLMMPQAIPCVLDSPIDSTLPGPIACHTNQDVLSPAGVVLMKRNTLIMGEYKNNLSAGQNRLFTMAATAYTPEGIPVPLDAPMADGMGRAGMDGNVDPHTLQRFGGAVLLSLANSGLSVLSSALQRGGNTNLDIQTGDMNSLASEILRSTINVPPTITVPQGKEVTVWVRYPIDFSGSIRLRAISQ